jgi:hypothetical protein
MLGTISAIDAHAAGGAGHGGGHWGGHGGGHPGGPFPFFAPFDPSVMLGAALLACAEPYPRLLSHTQTPSSGNIRGVALID